MERIRAKLQAAVRDGALTASPYRVSKKLLRQTTAGSATSIFGGAASHDCQYTANATFEREDGTWFTFWITLVAGNLDSYSFQICFRGEQCPTFLRFELDAPGTAQNSGPHEAEGLRSHLHPGHNDLRVPAPVLSPLELLDFFLYGLRRTAP